MLFINIDGQNGIGKTTTVDGVIKLLEEKGIKAKFVHFHRRDTVVGNTIQKVLNGEAKLSKEAMQMLYAVDRLEFTKTEYSDIIKEGYEVLVTDRYMTSGYAIGMAMGIPFTTLHGFDINCKKPDMNFILYANANTVMERLKTQKNVNGQTGDIFETKENVLKIQKGYAECIEYLDDVIAINVNESTQTAICTIFKFILENLEELNEKKEGLKKLSDYRKQWDIDKANGRIKQTGRGIR